MLMARTLPLPHPNPHQPRHHTRSTGMCPGTWGHRLAQSEFTAAGTFHFRGASDGTREAEFVVDEVVVKTAEFIDGS